MCKSIGNNELCVHRVSARVRGLHLLVIRNQQVTRSSRVAGSKIPSKNSVSCSSGCSDGVRDIVVRVGVADEHIDLRQHTSQHSREGTHRRTRCGEPTRSHSDEMAGPACAVLTGGRRSVKWACNCGHPDGVRLEFSIPSLNPELRPLCVALDV